MDLIRKALAGLVPARELTSLHVEGLPPSVRIIQDRTSTLVVTVSPIEHVHCVLSAFADAEAVVYGLANQGRVTELGLYQRDVRYGFSSGQLRRRITRHLANLPVPAARTVFVVAGRNANVLTADLALALESELARRTPRAGAYSVVGAYSFPTLSAPMQLVVDRWIDELRLLLLDAGLPVLEQAFPEIEARPAPLSNLRSGYSLAVPDDFATRANAETWRLDAGPVKATAFCWDGWTVLQAGATARMQELPSNQPCLTRKRRALFDGEVIKLVPRRKDLGELMRPLRVPSRLNGGRLLAGNNLDERLWRRIA